MKGLHFLKEKLLQGKPVIGIWSIINSPMLLDVAAHGGLDFAILDMEHGVYDLEKLDNCIRSCESAHCSPLIRVPSLQPTLIQSSLDMGSHGVIIPQVSGYLEALNVVKATQLPPQGKRGFNPFTRAGRYSPQNPLDSTKLNNHFPLVGIILENKNIFQELDKILKIPEIELLYLGIYDLSFDLGLNGNVEDPLIAQYVEEALHKIKKAGKYSGLMVKNEKEIERYLKLGANLFLYGVDTHIYLNAIQQRVSQFRSNTDAKD